MRVTFDPAVPGTVENYEHVPPIVSGQRIAQVVQYTHTNQFEFFRDWINYYAVNDCNVRFADDGTTIRWWYAYYLPLGHYMVNGSTVYADEESLRYYVAPFAPWPDTSAGMHEWFYDTNNPPQFATDPTEES